MLKWQDVIALATTGGTTGNQAPARRVEKSDDAWRARLTPEQYRVTRQAGTEHAFSNPMCGLFEPGRYHCICCDALLFEADEKFDSGTGWPSFTRPATENAIAYRLDDSHGMQRVETLCNTCDAHLGHVFPDGPPPGGLRYCMNAVALRKAAD